MDNVGKDDGRELELLKKVINFSIHQRWITENESLQIKTESTTSDLERSLFQFMKNVKSDETASKLWCAIRCINELEGPLNSANDEHRFESKIMSKLFEKGLISEAEKSEFVVDRNPLELPPVIKNVFKYLKTTDVIKLRLVSKEWSSAGLKILFTRSTIKLDSPKKMSKFLRRFSKTSFEMIPFRKFTFRSKYDEKWSVDELEEFFTKQGQYITELKFNEMHLMKNCSKQKLKTWNITPWISNCSVAEQTKSNTKLSVSCEHLTMPTHISVDLSALDCIKELALKEVTVNLQDGIRITPTKLEFSTVKFTKDEAKLTQLHLNDIVDFSKATHITLENHSFSRAAIRLSFALNGDGKLGRLKLSNVTLTNFETCRWEVNKLDSSDLSTFPDKTEMHIKELALFCGSINGIFDLPMYIEKLFYVGINKDCFSFSEPVVLKYIKYLHVVVLFTDIKSLSTGNLNFPNLTHLYLENKITVDGGLDAAWIPKTVKVIRLTNIKIINTSNESLSLDKLILTPAKSFKIEKFCASRVQTKELILNFSYQRESNKQTIVDILGHQNVCRDCVQRFYMGHLFWKVTEFDNCSLRFYVDRESKCYLLENEKGKAIEQREFDLLQSWNKITS